MCHSFVAIDRPTSDITVKGVAATYEERRTDGYRQSDVRFLTVSEE
jgi:hypothetical protein